MTYEEKLEQRFWVILFSCLFVMTGVVRLSQRDLLIDSLDISPSTGIKYLLEDG